MSELDTFISQFSGLTEEYSFYNGEVILRYEPKNHVYYLVTPKGLVPQDGVTTVCGILDKSNALIPWACKMMAQEILDKVREGISLQYISWNEFESLILAAKSAHKKKLDAASYVGNMAHDWIEQYIKACLSEDITRKLYLMNNTPDDYQAANCCEAAIDWMSYHNIRWIYTEKKVYSREYGYAGTMDGLCLADSCDDTQCCRSVFKDRLCLVDWKSSNELRIEYLLQTAAYLQAYSEEYDTRIDARWVIRLGKEDGEFEPWYVENPGEDWAAFRQALYLSRSINSITKRMKAHEEILKAERQAARKEARQAALAIECKGHSKYKGVRKPACNGGNPCQACLAKYKELHP